MEQLSTINLPNGEAVKLGGVIKENKVFDSTETTIFNWNYDVAHENLRKLYERGKTAQWNGSEDLDWSTDVDLEAELFSADPSMLDQPWYKKMSLKEQRRLSVETNTQTLSQFLHGEQGALIATAQLVSAVPTSDGKFYASTQVMDEARHVEVFDRYIREKLDGTYPITESLYTLLQSITSESRWDFKFLGMQLMVEGLALAAFMNASNRTFEPLLKKLLRMVMQDEARHVAYGVFSLADYYTDMSEKDKLERQEFVYEATVMMRDRLFSTQAYEKMGLNKKEIETFLTQSPMIKNFRSLMFANVVPNMKKIGLLDGFLREKYQGMGLGELEDFDTEGLLNSYIYGDNSLEADQKE